MTNRHHQEGQPGLIPAAFFGCCPQCHARSLFDGIARFAQACDRCGLDFGRYNVGDGPAAFLTLGVGAIIITLAILLDIAVRPPFWLHALIWIPFTIIFTILSLRVAKGILLIIEHRRSAQEAGAKDLEE